MATAAVDVSAPVPQEGVGSTWASILGAVSNSVGDYYAFRQERERASVEREYLDRTDATYQPGYLGQGVLAAGVPGTVGAGLNLSTVAIVGGAVIVGVVLLKAL